MNKDKGYVGIDYFRIISALLVIAIHTSPLTSINESADFILTRVIARVAVPFFFMTSGFFLISRYTYNCEKLITFIKKTAFVYGVAILIYIPINIYNSYFGMENILPNIIKDVVFDGTVYHLWYLPASVLGSIIAWLLVKKLDYEKAFRVSLALYVIGLLGDSYYGIAIKISCLKNCYNLLFQVTDYTRNGLFFAPIFFVIGGFIADKQLKITGTKCIGGLSISLVLMMGEALVLNRFEMQRHDSMYVFLIPYVYFLFHFLLHFKGKRNSSCSTLALIMYIIHPMIIVIVRFVAKMFCIQEFAVQNSVVHYLIVCSGTIVLSVTLTMLWQKFHIKKTKHVRDTDRTYIELDLHNLEHNINALKKQMQPGCELMAVLKADAYGHGVYEVATYLEKKGTKAFAVATIDEAIQLRHYGISGEILILGYTDPTRAKELYKYKLIQTLLSYDYSAKLNEQGYRIKAHIKIDTGMHRLGFERTDIERVKSVYTMKNINVCGIFTHLCVSDSLCEDDICFTRKQINDFYELIEKLKKMDLVIPKIHVQSSYGLLNYPEIQCDYVRVGISLYGVSSSLGDQTKLQLDLKPVLSLKTKIALLKRIPKGESVGYGRAFVAERDSIIATLPVGYADGYPRCLSYGQGYVLIEGQKAPIVGKICMDQLMVDVSDIPNVETGMTVTMIGNDGNEELTVEILAEKSGSITNEFLSRMGKRLKVVPIFGK